MQDFFTTIPGIIVTVCGILAVAVVGGLYLMGLIKGKKDSQDDRLIGLLKDTVTALEQKVDNQKKEHDEILVKLTGNIEKLTKKVDELEKENETLTKVLQGRDAQTQKFYAKAFEAFELIRSMDEKHNELMTMLVEHLTKTSK